MILAAGVALLVLVAVVLALAARRSPQPARVAVAAQPARSAPPAPAFPEPLVEPEPEPELEPVITWTATLTPAVLDEPARLRLIDDLALLEAPWSIALMRRAYDEESSPQLRARIEAVLEKRV